MLSKKTKYAISALVYIAKNIEEQPIPVSRISQEQNIPFKFLEAILAELRNARIVNSTKGKYGGYSLNGKPEDINMAEITRLFDGAIALYPCVTHQFYEPCDECIDEVTCGIRQVFLEIRNDTVEKLKAASLADIIKRENKIKKE